MKMLVSLWRSEGGASAAEFALVLPATLLLFFGVIDGGRYLWAVNRLEKAVQMGTRTAVVTNVVAEDLSSIDYIGLDCPVYDDDGTVTGTTPIKSGDAICKEAVPTIVCANPNGTVSCSEGTANVAAFNRILSRMRVVDPSIGNGEVSVAYSGSGIGYAGDPATDDDGNDLSDAAPVVTVSVERPQMRALFLLGGRIPLPSFTYSQTLEDGDGSVSY